MLNRFKSFFGYSDEHSNEADKIHPPQDVRVQYQKSMYAVKFDDADSKGSRKGVTVGFLRAKMGEILECDDLDSILLYQITPEKRRLVDNDSYLVDYDIMTGDRLLALLSTDKDDPKSTSTKSKKKKKNKKNTGNAAASGNASATPTPTRSRTPQPPPKTPQEKINEVLESTEKELGPHIDEFIKSPPKEKDARGDLHHRLSELVLQKMFLLDDVDVSDSQDLRLARKSAINTLHNYHTRLDDAFKNYEEAENTNS